MDEKSKNFKFTTWTQDPQKTWYRRPKYVGPCDVYGLVGGDTPHTELQPKKRLQRVLSLWKSTH